MIALHVTHEAVEKMGGIGAVIAGLATADGYRQTFTRTILAGPLLPSDRVGTDRLGPDGEVLYSSLDGLDTGGWAERFGPIERAYDVRIVYGTRRLTDDSGARSAEVEVLLVDVFRYDGSRLNLFKARLYEKFAIPCDRFEHIWEFEEYVRLAEPAWEAAVAVGAGGTPEEPVVLLAHEYMGMPTALKAMLDGGQHLRTVFYAHEVAPVRRIVEDHDGHDLMFYNLLDAAEGTGRPLEAFFPDSLAFFKHPLVRSAGYCHATFAVGPLVAQEVRFLGGPGLTDGVEAVFNGVPAAQIDLDQRRASRERMCRYAESLLGVRADYVFAHVARPVLSKGIWRDLRVLHELDPLLGRRGRRAVYFMLGTLAGQRRTRDVTHMERVYGWPVHHVRGYPDLCNGEETVGWNFNDFNRHHRAVQAVLVNQFGWERRLCGLRMPEDMSFADIRRGTDAEFGLSVYEPFGISQLEPLPFGCICVISSVCGCLGLLRHRAGSELPDNVLVADFLRLPRAVTARQAIRLGRGERDQVEAAEGRRLAAELMRRLERAQADPEGMIRRGAALAQQLDWQRVVEDFFLPAVRKVCRHRRPTGRAG